MDVDVKALYFSQDVVGKLGWYVYAYYYPELENEAPFYIGKGKGNRCFQHLLDNGESEKVRTIKGILDSGKIPRIEIIRHGLEENEALVAESVAIDLLTKDRLTNRQLGHGATRYGRMNVETLKNIYGSGAPLDIDTIDVPAVLIRVNQAYVPGSSTQAVYDITRGCWKLAMRVAECARYAFSVYQGVIIEVFEIAAWLRGDSTMRADGVEREPIERRIEFVGRLAPQDIRSKYVGKKVSIPEGARNPCIYTRKTKEEFARKLRERVEGA